MENRHFRMTDWKSPQMVKMMDFRIFRMPGLKRPKMVNMMNFRNFRRSQKPSGPGYPRRHQKRTKMGPKGSSRTTFGCYFIKYSRGLRPLPKEGGGLRPPPSFGSIFDEKGSKSGPGGTFWTYFDPFLMFSDVPRPRRFLGSPENPKIHDFCHFGTFQIGHPENPKIHDFDHFGTFQTEHPEIP